MHNFNNLENMEIKEIGINIGLYICFLFLVSGFIIFGTVLILQQDADLILNERNRKNLLTKFQAQNEITEFIKNRDYVRNQYKILLGFSNEKIENTETLKYAIPSNIKTTKCLLKMILSGNPFHCEEILDSIIWQLNNDGQYFYIDEKYDYMLEKMIPRQAILNKNKANFIISDIKNTEITNKNDTIQILINSENSEIMIKLPNNMRILHKTPDNIIMNLTPLLSNLLNLPIPYENIGINTIIFCNSNHRKELCFIENIIDVLENYIQITNYFEKICKITNKFDLIYMNLQESFQKYQSEFIQIFEKYNEISNSTHNSTEFIEICQHFINEIKNHISAISQNYFTAYFYTINDKQNKLIPIMILKFLTCISLLLLIISVLFSKEQNSFINLRFPRKYCFIPIIFLIPNIFAIWVNNKYFYITIYLFQGILLVFDIFFMTRLLHDSVKKIIKMVINAINSVHFICGIIFTILLSVFYNIGLFAHIDLKITIKYLEITVFLIITLLMISGKINFLKPYAEILLVIFISCYLTTPQKSDLDAANFLVFTALPTIILMLIYSFLLFKRTYLLRRSLKFITVIIFLIKSVFALHCQFGFLIKNTNYFSKTATYSEIENIKSNYYLSLCLHASSIIQCFIGCLAAIFPDILFEYIPTLKHKRITSIFVFIFIGVMPSILLNSGLYTVISYSSTILVIFLMGSILKEAGIANNFMHCVINIILLVRLFIFVSLNPDETQMNNLDLLLQIGGPIISIFLLIPIISINISKSEFTKLEAIRFQVQTNERAAISIREIPGNENVPISQEQTEREGEPERVSVIIAENLLKNTLIMEIMSLTGICVLCWSINNVINTKEFERNVIVNGLVYLITFSSNFLIGLI